MNTFRPLGYATLLLGVLLTLYLTLRQSGDEPQSAAAASATAAPTQVALGAAPPKNMRSNAGATKKHVAQQHCLAGCASESRMCFATTDGVQAKERCGKLKKTCAQGCQ